MKKLLLLGLALTAMSIQAQAMSDVAQAVVATSVAGVVNTGTAVYMQGQGMNPQFVTTPYGTTVVPGSTQPAQGNGGSSYDNQNQQSAKQSFFDGDS